MGDLGVATLDVAATLRENTSERVIGLESSKLLIAIDP